MLALFLLKAINTNHILWASFLKGMRKNDQILRFVNSMGKPGFNVTLELLIRKLKNSFQGNYTVVPENLFIKFYYLPHSNQHLRHV